MLTSIIAAVFVGLIYLFVRDRSGDAKLIQKKGGIDKLYPRFMNFIANTDQYLETLSRGCNTYETLWELVEKGNRKIEFRLPTYVDGFHTGYFHFSVCHDFRGRVEGHFVTGTGKSLNGSLIEFKKYSPEPSEEEYAQYCATIGNKIFCSQEYLKHIGDFID